MAAASTKGRLAGGQKTAPGGSGNATASAEGGVSMAEPEKRNSALS